MRESIGQVGDLRGGVRIFSLVDLNRFAGKDIEFTSSALTPGIHYGHVASEVRENADPGENSYTVTLTDTPGSVQRPYVIRADDLGRVRLIAREAQGRPA